VSSHQRFTEEELADLALSADPDQPIAPDAVPFGLGDTDGLLPSWYMPKPGRATG
jgi:hypothetical protein